MERGNKEEPRGPSPWPQHAGRGNYGPERLPLCQGKADQKQGQSLINPQSRDCMCYTPGSMSPGNASGVNSDSGQIQKELQKSEARGTRATSLLPTDSKPHFEHFSFVRSHRATSRDTANRTHVPSSLTSLSLTPPHTFYLLPPLVGVNLDNKPIFMPCQGQTKLGPAQSGKDRF